MHFGVFLQRLLWNAYTSLLTGYKKVRPVLDWTGIVDVHIMFNLYQAKSLTCLTDFSLRF